MSRRDTIIVAVLVNAALLMILFATAVRSDDAEPSTEKKQVQLAKAPVEDKKIEEDLLNQYVTSVPTLAEEEEQPLTFTEEIPLVFTPPEPIVEKKVVIEKPKSNESYVDVTVKKGDYLEKIAKANNTNVAAIRKANNLASDQLKIGQVLKVPLSEGIPKQQAAPSLAEDFYVVQDGDSPWLIAKRNNLPLNDLLRLNGLDEQKARRLRPGDRLKIR